MFISILLYFSFKLNLKSSTEIMRRNDHMVCWLQMEICKGVLYEHCFLIEAVGPVASVGRAASSSLCSQGLAIPEVPVWIVWSVRPGWGTHFPLQWPLCEAAHEDEGLQRGVSSFSCQEESLQNNILGSVGWQQEEEDPRLKVSFAAHYFLMTLKHAKDVRELIVNFLCLMFFILSWAYIQT